MKSSSGLILLSGVLVASTLQAADLFVDSGSAQSVPPYISWDFAAHSIQAAVSRAADGDTVRVNGGNGTKVYTGSNVGPDGQNSVVLLTNNVTVLGIGNPIIDGQAAARGVYMTDGQMSGFTLQNGAAYEGGGAYIYGGSLRNSIVVSNTASHGGGGIFLRSGDAVNCLVARNNGGVFFNGGGLVNCTVAANGGTGLYLEKNASVFNCVSWSNSLNWRLSESAPATSVSFFFNNCTFPAYSGGGDANANTISPPRFLDYAAGNYRLGQGTSCLNGGLLQSSLGYGDTDLDGNPRVVWNKPDIGAYEIQLWQGWDSGYQDLSGGWKWLSWFGYFADLGDGWIYHNEHGFLYATLTSTESDIWFWAQDLGWLWTSSTSYPYLYRSSTGVWLWYQKDSDNPRWFYNFGTSGWESR